MVVLNLFWCLCELVFGRRPKSAESQPMDQCAVARESDFCLRSCWLGCLKSLLMLVGEID